MTEEFEFVSNLLKEPLSDEPELLIKDLEAIEVWNARMQFLLAEANSELSKNSYEYLPPEGTELERKTAMTSAIAGFKMKRDKIEGLCEAIKTRITLGQSILRFYSMTNISYPVQKDSLRNILEK